MSLEEQLRQLFAAVFGVEPGAVTDDESPHTIEAWDSVGHLNLILSIEAEFGVQFEAEEIPELVSFRAIRERLTGARITLE